MRRFGASGTEGLNNEIFVNHAKDRLKRLNGTSHSIFSGVCLRKDDDVISFHTETKVYFANHPEEFLQKYVDEGDGADKAGGYGIQECFDY